MVLAAKDFTWTIPTQQTYSKWSSHLSSYRSSI